MMWHGRGFGLRSYSVFVPSIIFNGHLFMTAMLWGNFVNGYSGLNFITHVYYALFRILNTNFLPITFLVLLNDV